MSKTAGYLALALVFIFIPVLGFCSIFTDGAAIAEAWHRMNNFMLISAISLWTTSLFALGRIRHGTPINPALAKALAFTLRSINLVCLFMVVLHFSPEMEDVFDFVAGFFGRVFN